MLVRHYTVLKREAIISNSKILILVKSIIKLNNDKEAAGEGKK